jgi:putative phosphoesterase
MVFGNIDNNELRSTFKEELLFEIEGLKVLMMHIGGSPPRYARGVKGKIKSLKPDLFVCGHSHICKVLYDDTLNCLYMNPGAIGNQGFHLIKTMLKFQVENGKIQRLEVIELGRRGSL